MRAWRNELRGTGGKTFAVVILAGSRVSTDTFCQGITAINTLALRARLAGASEVLVVADSPRIAKSFRHLNVSLVSPSKGLATSIRAGLSGLTSAPDAVVLCLCDQHRISSGHLLDLASAVLEPGGPAMAASAYDGVLGVPAAFRADQFARLLELQGNAGARAIIREAGADVVELPFEGGNDRLALKPAISWTVPFELLEPALKAYREFRPSRAPPAFSRSISG